MVQALAFAELFAGGLLLVSAISAESLGELLTKGLTEAGRAKLHGEASASGVEGSVNAPGGSPGAGAAGAPPTSGAPLPGERAPAPGSVGIPRNVPGIPTAPVGQVTKREGFKLFEQWQKTLEKQKQGHLSSKELGALLRAVEQRYKVTLSGAGVTGSAQG